MPASRKPACLTPALEEPILAPDAARPGRGVERKSIGASFSAWASRRRAFEAGGHAGAAELAEGALQFDERSCRDLLGLLRDDVAVVGELADQGIDLAERERARRAWRSR